MILTYMWNVKNKANEQMNKIETVSQIQRRNSGCHKVGGGGLSEIGEGD